MFLRVEFDNLNLLAHFQPAQIRPGWLLGPDDRGTGDSKHKKQKEILLHVSPLFLVAVHWI
jgi:hypothetical protein